MGYYTEKEPSVDQSFIERVSHALDLDPYSLAKAAGVEYKDVEEVWAARRNKLAPLDNDIMWARIAEYIDRRIGYLIAAREELNRKLLDDRARRTAQHARIMNR